MDQSPPEVPPRLTPRPKWPWITLLVLETIQLLSLVPWLAFAGLAVMAFDAPGSDKMWQPWAFVLAIWSYPLWLLAAAVACWLLFAFRWYRTSVGLGVLFTLPVPGLLLLMLVGSYF